MTKEIECLQKKSDKMLEEIRMRRKMEGRSEELIELCKKEYGVRKKIKKKKQELQPTKKLKPLF